MMDCNHPIDSLSKAHDGSAILCGKCGVMFRQDESFGMKVRLWHNLEGGVVLEELRNVTEIHYNYRRRNKHQYGSGEVMVAFESDIHGTGITYRLASIVEFEAVPEIEKAESF